MKSAIKKEGLLPAKSASLSNDEPRVILLTHTVKPKGGTCVGCGRKVCQENIARILAGPIVERFICRRCAKMGRRAFGEVLS